MDYKGGVDLKKTNLLLYYLELVENSGYKKEYF